MNKTVMWIGGIVIILGGVYYYMRHKKGKHPVAHTGSAPAVKKHGKGGWRHRLSSLARGMAKTALASSGIPGASQVGQVAGI